MYIGRINSDYKINSSRILKIIKNIKNIFSDYVEKRKKLSDKDKINEAIHLIDEIKLVDVDKAFDLVKSRINMSNSKTHKIFTWITRVAAMLLIPLLAYNIWNYTNDNFNKTNENSIALQEISCPIGTRTHVVLPDGSDVWLNSGSKINYEIPFGREVRKLNLVGEAFLKVKKNKNSPFIVSSEKTKVKVLGTVFNVKAYPDDDQIEVALKEGSVNFSFLNSDDKKVYTPLKSGDYVVYNKRNKNIYRENKDLTKYISWSKNILIFDETPIVEVAKSLERWYGVKVIISDKSIKQYKITTTFENESLSRVLELLELSSHLSIKNKKGEIDKSTNKLNQSIITISKK